MPTVDARDVERAFRECSGRAVATLARRFGDIGLAEEMVQDAFVSALAHWPVEGVPPSPAGWIITTARRAAIDRLRRESTREERHREAMTLMEPEEGEEDDVPVPDDQLRLMFTCCHPSLAPASQVALTLRLIAGLETNEIARAFLVPEATMAQRLVRAKSKIRDAKIPYSVPTVEELPARLKWVLAVVYSVFNEGYVATEGDALGRVDLAEEAIRLGRQLVLLMPDEMEVNGLLALMLLIESRRAARTTEDGAIVRLGEQDRTKWNAALVAEGQAIVRRCLQANAPGPYQIQAAIQAVHGDAARAEDTDWESIVRLYDRLWVLMPTPVVALNRAIAVAELGRVAEALAIVDGLEGLGEYHLLHAARADLLERLGRIDEADAAYVKALGLTTNQAEIRLLEARKKALRDRMH